MFIRRVVTGHDETGTAKIVSDEDLAAGLFHLRVWGADETIVLPDDGQPKIVTTTYPRPGGFRMDVIEIPAGYDPVDNPQPYPEMTDEQIAAYKAQSVGSHTEAQDMHWTESVDCDLILSGELTMELDDGSSTVLRSGDIVIQNGTRHRWRNLGSVPAVLVAFMVGADHKGFDQYT